MMLKRQTTTTSAVFRNVRNFLIGRQMPARVTASVIEALSLACLRGMTILAANFVANATTC